MLLSAAAVFAMLAFSGCEKEGEGSDSGESGDGGENAGYSVEAYDVMRALKESQVDFPESSEVSSRTDEKMDSFGILFDGFDVENLESYAVVYSNEQTADEITVAVLKSDKDVEALKSSMRDRIQSRIDMFESYGPEEVGKLKAVKIISRKNVCALIVCSEPEKAAEAFKEYGMETEE